MVNLLGIQGVSFGPDAEYSRGIPDGAAARLRWARDIPCLKGMLIHWLAGDVLEKQRADTPSQVYAGDWRLSD